MCTEKGTQKIIIFYKSLKKNMDSDLFLQPELGRLSFGGLEY